MSCNCLIQHKWESYKILVSLLREAECDRYGQTISNIIDISTANQLPNNIHTAEYNAMKILHIQKNCCKNIFLTTFDNSEYIMANLSEKEILE
jgi:DNA-directed RNA polymerase subunit N (RpoN/RPB10)